VKRPLQHRIDKHDDKTIPQKNKIFFYITNSNTSKVLPVYGITLKTEKPS